MKSRALFLIGALLASSAWAQEPSFDLKGEAMKKIVRDTAASQSALVQIAEAKPVERKVVLVTEDLRPLETPIKIAPPRRIAAPEKSEGPLSALVGILIGEALGTGDDSTAQAYSDRWLRCQGREHLKTTTQAYDTCPGR